MSKAPRVTSSPQFCAPPEPDAVLLGTVALEPNRWGLVSPGREPSLRTADWLAQAEERFDGVELWENHVMLADPAEIARLEGSKLPLSIFSSYASFDDDDDTARAAVAAWVSRLRCSAVKFNVGKGPADASAYARRLSHFAEMLPAETRLLCECHAGTAAEDPHVAEAILSAVGDVDRVQALVHLGDDGEYIDSMFEALGDRICHVHVNFLRQGAPVLAEIEDDVRARVARLRANGFVGSYTIEFVNGVGTDRDTPADLLAAAISDLALLRRVLQEGSD